MPLPDHLARRCLAPLGSAILLLVVQVGCSGGGGGSQGRDAASGTGGRGGGDAGGGGGAAAGGAGGRSGSDGGSGSGGVVGSGGSGSGGAVGSGGGSGSGGAVGSGGATGTGGGGGRGGAGGGAGAAGNGGAPAGAMFVYVGSENNDIAVFAMDQTTGELASRSTTTTGAVPSFIAVEPTRRFLFAVNEYSAMVAAFSINRANGGLTLLGRVSSNGAGPAHISVDRAGRYVLVANYEGGTTSIYPILADGRLGAPVDAKSPGTQPHLILTDPSNRFAFVPCKGSSYVSQYLFDAATGVMTANNPARVMTAAGAGPRHLAFHPGGTFVYLINELNSTMNAYTLGAVGTLVELQSLSTLPAGFSGQNSGAEVVVAPGGGFVYGSNRGHNSIVIYSVGTDGRLTLVGHQSTGGTTPRSFDIDPTGTFLYAANQGSDTVVTFRINPTAGTLTQLRSTTVPDRPEFVGVFAFPP
jgi:6-phosphogluconolactonase